MLNDHVRDLPVFLLPENNPYVPTLQLALFHEALELKQGHLCNPRVNEILECDFCGIHSSQYPMNEE